MSSEQSIELKQYVAEQITDYIAHQTTGTSVETDKMKILEKGVYAICMAAYPEHESILSKQVPRLVRSALAMNQLNLTGKMQRIIDTALPKSDIMNSILGDITAAKIAPVNHSNIAKDSWVHKIQSERRNLQGIGNER